MIPCSNFSSVNAWETYNTQDSFTFWKTNLIVVLLCLCSNFLFLWLFPSRRVAGMTDDLSSPHCPVRLLARSQPSTFQISLTRVFPSRFRSSSLPFPWYIRSQHFPQYVFAISPHHMPVPVQSSLGDLFGSLRHSCCSAYVLVYQANMESRHHEIQAKSNNRLVRICVRSIVTAEPNMRIVYTRSTLYYENVWYLE